jgi:DNA modification methylase
MLGAMAKAASKPSAVIDTRVIYCGDNLEQLRKLPDACVDLIYIDPPFNSNRNYEVFWGETKEKRAFADRHASTQAYIEFMRPRCIELHRVLKKTGSFYHHADWHASHHVRVMLDQIFGANSFQAEIIWKRTTAKSLAFRGIPNNHDTIFYYTKRNDFTWNRPFIPYELEALDEKTAKKYCYRDVDGRRYTLGDLTNPNQDRPNLTYEFLGHKKVWRWTKERMEKAFEAGIVVQPSPGAIPRIKRYLDEREGKPLDDVWIDIPPINSQAAERLGYPTQKPLALLERIIKASSNENDIVLDAFCGCGTALVAAQKLKRQWIGIDVSPTACRVMAKRLKKDCGLKEDEKLWEIGRGFIVRDLPKTEEELRKYPAFEFENWAVVALGGIPNKVQVGDLGIDGRIYPVSAIPELRVKENVEMDFMDVWYPIQVKQTDKVGRPDIDAFETAMQRARRKLGYFVGFDFTGDALFEIDRFRRESGCEIKPLTVREILDEEISAKSK